MERPLTKHAIQGFNYVSISLLLLFLGGGWAAYHYVPAYYKYSQSQTILQSSLYSNLKNPDEVIQKDVSARLKSEIGWNVPAQDVVIFRSEDQRWIKLGFTYVHQVAVPLLDISWDMKFSPTYEKDLTKKLIP